MSVLHALTVPKWGMSMEEGEIVEWHVTEGDRLSPGDPLVDIETSKIVNTAESTCSGTLVRVVAGVGETHRVGALLAVAADGDAADADVDAFIAAFVPGAGAAGRSGSKQGRGDATPKIPEVEAAPAPAAAVAAPAVELAAGPDDSQVKSSPVARRLAREFNINLNNVEPSGRHGRVSKWDVERAAGVKVEPPRQQPESGAAPAAAPQPSRGDDSQVPASAVARRLATQMQINLLDVPGTGRHGRVSKADVEQAALQLYGASDFSSQPLTGMRRTIASRLSESKQTIPHYRVSVDVEIDSLLAQRAFMKQQLGMTVSVNDFVLKSCASALLQVPEVNVQFTGDAIRQFRQVDIAMAVAVEGGLITPVIRDAASKGLTHIAAESAALAEKAQQGRLGPDDYRGGTFSVSNLGMYGVDQFDAIINPPQAAILAVAAGKRVPVVRGDAVVPATVMRLSLSCDHRVIDGALAARFLQVLRGFLENPAAMLV